MRKLAFLIFHDINVALAFAHTVSFFHVLKQLSCFYVKNASHDVRTIRCDLFEFQFILYFFSIRIDRNSDEQSKSLEMFDYDYAVLKQFLHESRIIRIIERKNKSSTQNRRINVITS
jgi:hypothetical protein